MKHWIRIWRLKRIIEALNYATKYGLKKEVGNFASALEATALMARGTKRDQDVTISVKRADLDSFIAYMTRLHTSKLSLLHRARIGLATLVMSSKGLLGETAEEFYTREVHQTKSSKDDKRIIQLKK